MRFKFGNIPPREAGGFHFPQKLPNGGVHTHYASTKDELDREILRFRVNNNIPEGNPEIESNDYLCDRFPNLCSKDVDPVADESPENKTLRQRTTNWRMNRFAQAQNVKERVSQELADARVAVCSTCPNNQKNEDGCGTCVEANRSTLFQLRDGKNVKTSVGGCTITGQDNATAAFFPPELLKYKSAYLDKLPSFCWLLDEVDAKMQDAIQNGKNKTTEADSSGS